MSLGGPEVLDSKYTSQRVDAREIMEGANGDQLEQHTSDGVIKSEERINALVGVIAVDRSVDQVNLFTNIIVNSNKEKTRKRCSGQHTK